MSRGETSLLEGYPCFEGVCTLDSVISRGTPEVAAQELNIELSETLRDAVPKRLYEFIAGRVCAQEALKQAGCRSPGQIPFRPDRSPQWPAGFVGSIAHSADSAWAVVGTTNNLRGIGVDIESYISPKVAGEIAPRILRSEELLPGRVSDLAFERYLTLLFSAKESLYKCVAPICGEYFDFQDAECIEIDEMRGTFLLLLRRSLSPEIKEGAQFEGRFSFGDEVRTVIVAEAHR